MVHFLRKLRVKFSGDDKYLPADFPADKFIPVLGYGTQKRIQMKNQESGQPVPVEKEDVVFYCIGTSGKLVRIAEFNCSVMVDEKAETDALSIAGEMCGKLSQAVGNCNILLKYLSGQAADTDKAVNDVKDQG